MLVIIILRALLANIPCLPLFFLFISSISSEPTKKIIDILPFLLLTQFYSTFFRLFLIILKQFLINLQIHKLIKRLNFLAIVLLQIPFIYCFVFEVKAQSHRYSQGKHYYEEVFYVLAHSLILQRLLTRNYSGFMPQLG